MSSAASRPLTKRKPIVRVILVLVSLVAAWHIFAQFLWIAPPSALRQIVPGNFLTSWQIPFFGQSWSVFAPEPINGNYHFYVRATVDENGKTSTTKWVDAADAELNLSRHNLFPPRAAGLGNEIATNYRNAYNELDADQLEIIKQGYWKGSDWKARMETELKRASDSDEALGKASAFITQNAWTDAYATQVAWAMWGEDNVTAIQFSVMRQNVIPFSERNDPDAEPEPEQWSTTGWRGTFVMPGQSNEAFADTFKKLVKEQ